jgi:hypothetical protein
MFTWNDVCDTALMTNGRMVAMTDANKETNISIVETVSNEIGKKLDWHYAGGRGIIRVLPEDHDEAFRVLSEKYPNGKLNETHSIVLYAKEVLG